MREECDSGRCYNFTKKEKKNENMLFFSNYCRIAYYLTFLGGIQQAIGYFVALISG